MSNNPFDWNRFLTLLKINLKLNRGVYTAVAIITMVLAFSFVMIFNESYKPLGRSMAPESYLSRHSVIFSATVFIISILISVMSCMSFFAFRTPKQRIFGFTLPATYLEKYLANVLPVTLGYFIYIILCVTLVNLLRETFLPFHNPMTFSDVLSPICSWKMLHQNLFTMAFCVLGSTIWHRNTFWYTMLASICFTVIINSSLGTSFTVERSGVICAIINIVFTVYCFVLSYFRFKEMEVISRF